MTFTVAWLVWIGVFLVVEGVALFNSKPGDTLSEHLWTWFGTSRRIPVPDYVPLGALTGHVWRYAGVAWRWAGPVVLTGFMVWLTAHLATGGKV